MVNKIYPSIPHFDVSDVQVLSLFGPLFVDLAVTGSLEQQLWVLWRGGYSLGECFRILVGRVIKKTS